MPNCNNIALLVLLSGSTVIHATEIHWHGLIDIRGMLPSTSTSWGKAGLGKTRYDKSQAPMQLAQSLATVSYLPKNSRFKIRIHFMLNPYDGQTLDLVEAIATYHHSIKEFHQCCGYLMSKQISY